MKAHGHGQPHVHTIDVFHAILQHERSRSDRDGNTFALVVFDVSHGNSNGTGVEKLVGKIQEKMRSIDEIGWLDSRRLGVLLPITSLQGGEMFARRALELSPASSPPIPWQVHAYPSSYLSGSGQNNGHGAPETNGKNGTRDGESPSVLGDVFSARIPVWKRTIDFTGSALLIVLLSPVFLLLSIYIKIASPGRILFRQARVGYRGKRFTFLKFRTMRENSDPNPHRQYLKELIKGGKPMEKLDIGRDPRIIPGGRIIRKACLDELPQLFNVLRGDMSLVGPRPCIVYEAEEYLRWHTHRFNILPGMTGLWQVSGKNRLSFEEMIRLDISYASNISLLRDLKILLLTVPTIIGMVFEASARKIRANMVGLLPEGMNKAGGEKSFGDA